MLALLSTWGVLRCAPVCAVWSSLFALYER